MKKKIKMPVELAANIPANYDEVQLKILGEQLKIQREKAGKTQLQTDEHLDKKYGWIADVEAGKIDPWITELMFLCRFYKIDASVLFKSIQRSSDKIMKQHKKEAIN